MQTQMRTQYTLDAFNALAHYLANFPGRKNLIWFSGSFPLQIEPDPTLNDPFAVMADSNEEFRETTNLLALAQTAVYPVDARGLMTAPMFDAYELRQQICTQSVGLHERCDEVRPEPGRGAHDDGTDGQRYRRPRVLQHEWTGERCREGDRRWLKLLHSDLQSDGPQVERRVSQHSC